MDKNRFLVKSGCYLTSMSMSVAANLSPLLFLTFRALYGISYSLLGLLVLINFLTQLLIDLIFSFFSHKFNIEKTVKLTPVICAVGLAIYSLTPFLFAHNIYAGLVISTVIFSASSGLSEVLISPVIAALPSDDPEREMSRLHSVYAWGTVFVIVASSAFLWLFGNKMWFVLLGIFMIIPLLASLFFAFARLPLMQTPERASVTLSFFKDKQLYICFFAIFFGGAAECTMAQWCSGYLELALGIPKIYGDILGVAMFAVAMGIGRSLYAKRGKNIARVIFLGAVGASVCYIVCAVSPFAAIGLFACALTGYFVAMMWPGCLIIASDKFTQSGVFIYALMAAGGDLGASVGPQMIGVITDASLKSEFILKVSSALQFSAEQTGMRIGILIGAVFPLVAILFYYRFLRESKQKRNSE